MDVLILLSLMKRSTNLRYVHAVHNVCVVFIIYIYIYIYIYVCVVCIYIYIYIYIISCVCMYVCVVYIPIYISTLLLRCIFLFRLILVYIIGTCGFVDTPTTPRKLAGVPLLINFPRVRENTS